PRALQCTFGRPERPWAPLGAPVALTPGGDITISSPQWRRAFAALFPFSGPNGACARTAMDANERSNGKYEVRPEGDPEDRAPHPDQQGPPFAHAQRRARC